MLILLQILSLLFAVACGVHDVVPVLKMIRYGASPKEALMFHRSGFMARGLFAAGVSICNGVSYETLFLALSMGFIMWAGFDISLGWIVKGKAFYVGQTASLDKWLRRWGRYAGQIKAGFCLLAVGILNWLIFR